MSLGVQIWLYAMTIDKYPDYQSVLVSNARNSYM